MMKTWKMGIAISGLAFLGACQTNKTAQQADNVNTTVTISSIDNTSTQSETQGEIYEYVPSGRFSSKQIGWTLPTLKTRVKLYDLGDGETIRGEKFSGLYKDSKMDNPERLGTDRVPYNNLEYLKDETDEQFSGIIKSTYHDKIYTAKLGSHFVFTQLKHWTVQPNANTVQIAAPEQKLSFTVTVQKGATMSLDNMRQELGKVYADKYGELLEKYDRQGVYFYDKLNDGKATGIVFIYGGKNQGDDVFLDISLFEENGVMHHIKAQSKDFKQLVAWYLVFNQVNKLGKAVGY